MNKSRENMKYVLTTNLIKSKKVTHYLGKWALSEEDLFKNKKIINYIWDDKNIFLKDSNYIRSLCLKILNNIYIDLNKVHNKSYSKKFWKNILVIWLYHYVSSLYFRWRMVEKVNKSFTFIIAGNIQNQFLPPEDIDRFLDKTSQNDFWNQKLIDEIILLLNKKYIYKKISNKFLEEKKNIQSLSIVLHFIFPTFLFNFINILFKYLPTKNMSLIKTCYNKQFFFSFPIFIFEAAYNKFLNILNYFFIKNSKEDVSARNKFSKIFIKQKFFSTSFEKYLKKKIIQEMPKSYLENFKNYTNRCIHRRKSKIIISSYFLYNDNFDKFDVALSHENGTKVYLLEHGGSLPCLKDYLDLDKIYLTKISWFRHRNKNKAIQSKLNPIFFRFNENYFKYSKYLNKSLLIIGGGGHRWVQSCPYMPQATQRLNQLLDLKNFFKVLNNKIKKKIILKVHPHFNKENNNFDYTKLYKNIFRKKQLTSHKIDILFHSSKIVVCVYPETTFAQAMAIGIPTILFFEKKNYIFHKDTKKILNDLIDCKILFTNPRLAADHINNIWKDPLKWFYSDKVNKVRKHFLNLALNRDKSESNIQNRIVNFF
jgi:putative transferase (TIGR04331 family)